MEEVEKNSCNQFREMRQHELEQLQQRLGIEVENNTHEPGCVRGVYARKSQTEMVLYKLTRDALRRVGKANTTNLVKMKLTIFTIHYKTDGAPKFKQSLGYIVKREEFIAVNMHYRRTG